MSTWKYSNYSKVLPEVRENFPFSSARKDQLETISEIAEAINKGYKYIVLEAGTGTGKSAIAATLARMYEDAYILTITKQLQKQYLDDFMDIGFKLVKGRNNFHCRSSIENLKCDKGACIEMGLEDCKYKVSRENFYEKTKEDSCEYLYQKVDGLLSDVVITNYTYAYLDLNFDDIGFGHRELMICDEAHNLENQLMKELTLEFERKQFKEDYNLDLVSSYENLENKTHKEWCNFLERIIEIDVGMMQMFLNKYRKSHLPSDKVKMKEYGRRVEKLSMFKRYINNDPRNWILDYDNKGEYKVFFKPKTVNDYADNALFRFADHCIFMSATILDYKLFAKYLGINEDEIYAIRRKSSFDTTRNPITIYDLDMNHQAIKTSSIKSLPIIKKILKKHRNEKGIIHTVSNDCAKFIMNNISDDRLISHINDDRQKVLDKFESSKDSLVLVSPSMDEGVDLPGDKCRFQIIYKVPYLPVNSDKQIEERRTKDPDWYFYRTVLKLIQTYGRGMRFENDECQTYVMDMRIKKLVSLNKRLFPESFFNAINVNDKEFKKLLFYTNSKKKRYRADRNLENLSEAILMERLKPSVHKKEKKKPRKLPPSYSKTELAVTDEMREQASGVSTNNLSSTQKIALMQINTVLDNQKLVKNEGLSDEIESEIREDITVLIKLGKVKNNTVRTAIQGLIKNYK